MLDRQSLVPVIGQDGVIRHQRHAQLKTRCLGMLALTGGELRWRVKQGQPMRRHQATMPCLPAPAWIPLGAIDVLHLPAMAGLMEPPCHRRRRCLSSTRGVAMMPVAWERPCRPPGREPRPRHGLNRSSTVCWSQAGTRAPLDSPRLTSHQTTGRPANMRPGRSRCPRG